MLRPSLPAYVRAIAPTRISPYSYVGEKSLNDPNEFFECNPIGRLRAGVTLVAANSELATFQSDLIQRFIPQALRHYPLVEHGKLRVLSARTGLPFLYSDYTQSIKLMQILMAVVLFLCCLNVGGLMLSKMYARRYEFAVRTAIGAAKGRLVRQYLTESLVIAFLGGLVAAFIAWFGIGLISQFFLDPDALEALQFSPTVLFS